MSLFTPGSRLRDRFTMVERVGVGGMSEVWRATDEVLGRAVAVKALAAPLATDPALREATWREARAAAQLTHPDVTQVHDYGELPLPGGGVAGYLVMELVEGETLAARIARGPLPWPEAARVTGRVAAALAAAHRLGVVHRDIKPGNVMLTDTGVKVLDFGIAAVAGLADTGEGGGAGEGGGTGGDGFVGGGGLAGTPTYAAPERLEPLTPVQPASDVYSLGVLLYEALAGHPPARLGSWAEAVARHRDGRSVPPLPVAGLPDRLVRLCEACLSADPAGRPSAGQVAAELAGAVGEQPFAGATAGSMTAGGDPTVPGSGRYTRGFARLPATGATPPTQLDGEPATPRRRSRLPLAGAAVALVVLGLLVTVVVAALRPEEREPLGAGPAEVTAEPGESGVGAATDLPPPTSRADPANPASPDAIISELDRALLEAVDAEAINRDTLDDLRDELGDLREALENDDPEKRDEKLRDEAEDMIEEIADLADDGELDRVTAAGLTELLDPLRDL